MALPTETVFGLAVAISSPEGVKKLITLKDRGIKSGKVFTLVPESIDDIQRYVQIGQKASRLIRDHIPGALTLVLPKNPDYHNEYFDNFREIGIRIPDFNLFQELLPKSGALLLTSANLRGAKTCQTATEVMETLPVDGIVDGVTGGKQPSTVVRISDNAIEILRQGGLQIGTIDRKNVPTE